MVDDPERQTDSAGDGGWESGSVNEGEPESGSWESGLIADSGTEEEKSEEDEPDSDNDELNVTKTKTKTQTQKSPKATKGLSSTLQSTFLPSLSVGFVHGSGDSDFSDAEGRAADIPRKNRRGQRARRAIWEKKFGRNANHNKKEAQENRGHTSTTAVSNTILSRNVPPDQGPPRPSARGRNFPQQYQPIDANRDGRSSGAVSVGRSVKRADRKGDKPLHPSWEAKRRLKEKEGAGIVPSQGTKIRFA